MSDEDIAQQMLAMFDEVIARKRQEVGQWEELRAGLVRMHPQLVIPNTPPPEPRPPLRLDLTKSGDTPAPGAGRTLAGIKSIPDASEVVLREAKRPMNSEEIARALIAGGFHYQGNAKALAATVRGVLGREVRSNPERGIVRPERGVFALKEWGGRVITFQEVLARGQRTLDEEDEEEIAKSEE